MVVLIAGGGGGGARKWNKFKSFNGNGYGQLMMVLQDTGVASSEAITGLFVR